MKILIYVFLLIHYCNSEIPPLQNIQSLLSNQNNIPHIIYGVPANVNYQVTRPHTQYGVPNRDIEPVIGNNIPRPPPSKVQNPGNPIISLQQQHIQNLQQLRPPVPQQQYGPPPTKFQNQQVLSAHQLNCNNLHELQAPRPVFQQNFTPTTQTQQLFLPSHGNANLYQPKPQEQYGPPNPIHSQGSFTNQNQNLVPQTTYGTPDKINTLQHVSQQQLFNTNCQNGNTFSVTPQHSFQSPDRFSSQRPGGSNINNNFANQIQRPQAVYGTPNYSGLEPFDIKNQPSKFTAFTQQQNLNDYRTITQDTLEFYERIKNFPVTRNQAFGRQHSPSITYEFNQGSLNQQQQSKGNSLYSTQQLPLQKSANFLQQSQANFALNEGYPNGQGLPIRESENFRQLPLSSYLPPSEQQNTGAYPSGQGLPFRDAADFRSVPENFNIAIQDLHAREQDKINLVNLLTPHVRDAFKQVTHSAQSDRNSDREAKALGNSEVHLLQRNIPPTLVTQKPLTSITQRPIGNVNQQVDTNPSLNTALDASVPGNHFYVIQPDGAFQRVTFNRTQEPGGHPQEYTANYYFKNIPPVADPLYNLNAPVIAIG